MTRKEGRTEERSAEDESREEYIELENDTVQEEPMSDEDSSSAPSTSQVTRPRPHTWRTSHPHMTPFQQRLQTAIEVEATIPPRPDDEDKLFAKAIVPLIKKTTNSEEGLCKNANSPAAL